MAYSLKNYGPPPDHSDELVVAAPHRAVSQKTRYSKSEVMIDGQHSQNEDSYVPHEEGRHALDEADVPHFEDAHDEVTHDEVADGEVVDAHEEGFRQAYRHQKDHAPHALGGRTYDRVSAGDVHTGRISAPSALFRGRTDFRRRPGLFGAAGCAQRRPASPFPGGGAGAVSIENVPGGGHLSGSWRDWGPMRLFSGR